MKFYTAPNFFPIYFYSTCLAFCCETDSVLFCAKETLKFTAHSIKTVCTFISFKEAALAVIWCWFYLALFRKVKWIWEPFHVALEFIQRFCVGIPFCNSLLSLTSFLKAFYNFVSFCAGGLCLLWCHWLLVLKEGREQRWNKLLIYWISQISFSGIWEFKAQILKEKGTERGCEAARSSPFLVAPHLPEHCCVMLP